MMPPMSARAGVDRPCPGSGAPPAAPADRDAMLRRGKVMIDRYGTCRFCRRDYYITSEGVLNVHKGLAS